MAHAHSDGSYFIYLVGGGGQTGEIRSGLRARVEGLGFRVQGNVLKSQNPSIYTFKYTWALTLENFYHQGVVVVDCAAGTHSHKSSVLSFSTVFFYSHFLQSMY